VEALCRNCCDDLSAEEKMVLEADSEVRQLLIDQKAMGCKELPCNVEACAQKGAR